MKQRKPVRTTETRMKLLVAADCQLVLGGGTIPKQSDSGSGTGTRGC